MNLVSFSVQNYRSIIKAKKLPISKSTILIGPNNEGKSNILRALVTALKVLKRLGSFPPLRGRIHIPFIRRAEIYEWETDFPVQLQQKFPNGESIFILEFDLSAEEITEFKALVGSNLSGTLPIQVSIDKEGQHFKIAKKGRGASSLTKKAQNIAHFVSQKLDYVYIPAIRTAKSAQTVVENILADELEVVEENDDFKKALQEIAKVQQPVLDRISDSIKQTLKEFLPNVKDVKVTISDEERYQALRRSCTITIDDGTPTSLQYKGDGIQSLAALSLMRHASEREAKGRNLILAIEEPESHLHPRAVHQLRQVLSDISTRSQVIITTHCPTFVDRVAIQSNIIVSRNKAATARNIKTIRDILGVKAADNLLHAELVLLVEGEDDKTVLTSLLSHASQKLKTAISQGTLAIDSLLGGANLAYKLSQLREALCNYYCFLDNDVCAKDAFRKAELDSLMTQADVTFSTCVGMNESEVEDLYEVAKYSDMILNAYGVILDSPKFRSNKKWSDRMKDIFIQQGKQWDDNIERQIKQKIAEIIAANPQDALNIHKRHSFDALISGLERKLDELSYYKGIPKVKIESVIRGGS